MSKLTISKTPVVEAGMLIRKSPAVVFDAFVNPEVTSNFWFTKSSGKLTQGETVEWTWEMYSFSAQVEVKEIRKNEYIRISWGAPGDESEVEWKFVPYKNDWTYVSITNSGFQGDPDGIIAKALDSVGGFTTVLDGAKAWLEHGIKLNLIEDKFPKGLTEH